ncbi:PREDICTED: probable magnesium transporter NIPA6 [Nelumbo nucifera]|uniref:Probable magnesium transporter n=1 Tax=Nelumbo nucifera TaxID=4432 RepID=A0A1U8Q7D6_NELNU|nr:PREDICTED: probable magnesium transporter NIPA6 [Nelumbo nucifera]
MFTTLTIIASAIMFKDWSGQNLSSITSEVCGFITVLSGTIIFHTTREQEAYPVSGTISWHVCGDSIKNIEGDHYIILHGADY